MTKRATDFIRNHPVDPFLLYVAPAVPHVPLQVSDKFRGKSGAGLYGDVIMEIDWSVGRILAAIEDIGVERNTLVLFASDNGPWLAYGDHAGSSGGLREGKGTMFEGGYRVPTIAWWPGKVPAGTKCDTLCSTIDVLPTVAKLTGASMPNQPIDGHDISDILFEAGCGPSPHKAFPGYYKNGQLQTIRNDQFKYIFEHKYRTLGGTVGGTNGLPVGYQQATASPALYDLDNDVAETTDVADQHPDIVEELKRAADRYRELFGDTLTGVIGNAIRPAGKMTDRDEPLPLIWP